MTRTLSHAVASRIGAAAAVFACVAVGAHADPTGNCQAGHLASLLGEPYSEDKARGASKASRIRVMTVGRTVVTAEFVGDRVNIVRDAKGIVVRADCG